MKSIIIIQFCVLLLTIVPNGAEDNPFVKMLNKMAKEKEIIHNVFQPSKNGYLGPAMYGHTYKGMFFPKEIEVAMKFTNDMEKGKHEYSMYTYLNAINKPDVEAYGIPAIYYYNTWKEYIIMAMTLFDPKFHQTIDAKKFKKIDLLIALRETVRMAKYMHGRRVFHKDIEDDHIQFRKHQGFIYDFNKAEHLPNAKPESILRYVRVDCRRLLNVIFHCIEGLNQENKKSSFQMKNVRSFVLDRTEDTKSSNMNGLEKVLVKMAIYAYGNKIETTTPFYDQLYELIIDEIKLWEQQRKKPAIPSWLTKQQDKQEAELAGYQIPRISTVHGPFESNTQTYDLVNLTFFSVHYRNFRCDQQILRRAS